MSDIEKEMAIITYIRDHCEYDYSFINHKLLVIIKMGKGVCDAYA